MRTLNRELPQVKSDSIRARTGPFSTLAGPVMVVMSPRLVVWLISHDFIFPSFVSVYIRRVFSCLPCFTYSLPSALSMSDTMLPVCGSILMR